MVTGCHNIKYMLINTKTKDMLLHTGKGWKYENKTKCSWIIYFILITNPNFLKRKLYIYITICTQAYTKHVNCHNTNTLLTTLKGILKKYLWKRTLYWGKGLITIKKNQILWAKAAYSVFTCYSSVCLHILIMET